LNVRWDIKWLVKMPMRKKYWLVIMLLAVLLLAIAGFFVIFMPSQ